jgi:hypothetical protein
MFRGKEMNAVIRNASVGFAIAFAKNNPDTTLTVISDCYWDYYRQIQAWEAKNYDGELAGWERGTPDGDRFCVERKQVRREDGKTVFTNFWR